MNTTLYKIQVQAEKCLQFRGASCDRCIAGCPTQALSFKGTIILSHEQCRNCGLCLHQCPSQVFTGHDEWNTLVAMVDGFSNKQSVELVCASHPEPNRGMPDCTHTVQTATCLAALGPSLFLALQAQGVEKIALRLDACRMCPVGLHEAMDQIISNATSSSITHIIQESPPDSLERTVHTSQRSTMSRRHLFRSLLGKVEANPKEECPSSPERTRLLHSLELLMKGEGHDGVLSQTALFLQTSIRDTCTACMACARSCSSGALRASLEKGKYFTLEFAPGLCYDCKLCISACRQDAIIRTPLAPLSSFEELNFSTLLQDEVKTCTRCKTHFRTGVKGSELCLACAFRRQNPFGAIGSLKKQGH